MRPSSARGQTEPLAALVAVVAVGLGLSLYVGVLDAELPGSSDRNVASSVIERVESAVAPDGIADPSLIDEARQTGPDGYETNVTISVDEHRWQSGPSSPTKTESAVDVATVRLGVRVAPAHVTAGTLDVRVWT